LLLLQHPEEAWRSPIEAVNPLIVRAEQFQKFLPIQV
jgi:hypothetical protein